MRFFIPFLLLLSPLSAAPDGWSEAPFSIPALKQDIPSKETGRTYRIFVYVPSTPAPANGYPVLYMLDGNSTYPLAALLLQSVGDRAAAVGINPGIIVGIGYPVDDSTDLVARAQDYTPPAPDLSDTGDFSEHPQGGADRFFDFIEKELKPELSARFPIDKTRQTIFGHSYGGLFTLHAYFTRPGAFQRYVASSPSIWWNKRHILAEKDAWLKNRGTAPAADAPPLLITVGALEQTPTDDPRRAHHAQFVITRRQVDNATSLADELSKAGFPVKFHLYQDDNHGTARVPAVSHALRVAFGK
ncbi:MAG: alpha/beta hydrolase-fold protein [Luteolibacter sp.]